MKFCRNFADILENVEIWNFLDFLIFWRKFLNKHFCKNFDRTLIWKVRMVRSLADRTWLNLGRPGQRPARPARRRWARRARSTGRRLSWKVRSARDRTIRTSQIGVRSEFLESKENHEKPLHRSGMRPKIQEGAGEKGNKLPWGSEADDALAPLQMMLYLASKDTVLAFTRGYACSFKIQEFSLENPKISEI